MKVRLTLLILLLVCTSIDGICGAPRSRDFREACDSLSARLNDHFGIESGIRVKSIKAEGNAYGVWFDKTFSDYPWSSEDYLWFMQEFDAEWAKVAPGYRHGNLYVNGIRFEKLVNPVMTNDGSPAKYGLSREKRSHKVLVRDDDRPYYPGGLEGRHIALWQSHGLYWNEELEQWRFQRAPLHRTVEDMFTQSFVLEYLIPMLENAGACIMTPRERDIQSREFICDNDPMFQGERNEIVRKAGFYKEKGQWSDAGTGFADRKKTYSINDNPFRSGTARKSPCTPNGNSRACWTAEIGERGSYAVYVSYLTLPESTDKAHYKVTHLGGESHFTVDQTIGGGTWIYLGTFEFEGEASVELVNKGQNGLYVSADAVRFGGGMGKIERGGLLSGKPAYMEGSSYSIPFSGADSSIREWDTDYRNDFATRGTWTRMMKDGKGIPFDCSLAFHSDAGITPNDSIVGTLSIYTLKNEDGTTFSDGSSRMSSRLFAQWIQDQVVSDIRTDFEPQWNRRQLWDRSYSESRTPDVPAMILELLSHQNFADMKYGLDPAFRFTVSRAVYKGVLKFLSTLYGTDYVVQPLPVTGLSVKFTQGGNAELSWQSTSDPKEATAEAESFIIYTRRDDGAFDKGIRTSGKSFEMPIVKGHIYSYKVVAENKGGKSFPSETVAIGMPDNPTGKEVLIVNNFDRVSAPAWIDSPEYAGFMAGLDSGVPYIRDITYIGENYEFRRSKVWETDDDPGFGGCLTEEAGFKPAGNTFDYPYIHGKSLMALGHPFCSMSAKAFEEDNTDADTGQVLDLICGKQVTTRMGSGKVENRYAVFPASMRAALRNWTGRGKSIIISGADIATDVWSSVYPVEIDETEREARKDFVQNVLGYKLSSSCGTGKGRVGTYEFYNTLNEDCYCVEAPDGLKPAKKNATIWIRYPASQIPAGVLYVASNYKVISLGVPLECIKKEEDRTALLQEITNKL